MDNDNNIVYREWAPNAVKASLIGDFSEWSMSKFSRTILLPLTNNRADSWNRESHPMKKNEFGVFEIVIPAGANGQAAIPHNSMIKVYLYSKSSAAPRLTDCSRFPLSCPVGNGLTDCPPGSNT